MKITNTPHKKNPVLCEPKARNKKMRIQWFYVSPSSINCNNCVTLIHTRILPPHWHHIITISMSVIFPLSPEPFPILVLYPFNHHPFNHQPEALCVFAQGYMCYFCFCLLILLILIWFFFGLTLHVVAVAIVYIFYN